MNFPKMRLSFLVVAIIAIFGLPAMVFDTKQHVDAQSATQAATSATSSGNGRIIFIDPQKFVGTNAPYYGYTILDLDTKVSQQIVLPTALRILGLVAVSPDGKSVAFTAINFKGDQTYNIYAMGINGANLRQLTKDTSGKSGKIVSGNSAPNWSPDGKQLLFIHLEQDTSVNPPKEKPRQLLVINADGTGNPQAIQPDNPVTFSSSS